MHDKSLGHTSIFILFILSIHVKYAFLLLTHMSNPDTCINHNSSPLNLLDEYEAFLPFNGI